MPMLGEPKKGGIVSIRPFSIRVLDPINLILLFISCFSLALQQH